MLDIWGRPYSSNVIPVLWTAGELDIAYRLHLAGSRFGKLDSDEYGRMNPNRVIPTIRDGDFILWESHAIVRYLCHRYGAGTLYPDDAQDRAIADQWMMWSANRAFPAVIQLFIATVRTAPEARDEAKIAGLQDAATDVLRLLDARLAEHDFVAGAHFSMADIPLGGVVYRYLNVPVERPDLPHLAAWFGRLSERPQYQKHVMRHFGSNPDEWDALEEASAKEGVL